MRHKQICFSWTLAHSMCKLVMWSDLDLLPLDRAVDEQVSAAPGDVSCNGLQTQGIFMTNFMFKVRQRMGGGREEVELFRYQHLLQNSFAGN